MFDGGFLDGFIEMLDCYLFIIGRLLGVLFWVSF